MYFSSSLGGVEVAVAVSGESVLAGWRPVEGGHGPGRRRYFLNRGQKKGSNTKF